MMKVFDDRIVVNVSKVLDESVKTTGTSQLSVVCDRTAAKK